MTGLEGLFMEDLVEHVLTKVVQQYCDRYNFPGHPVLAHAEQREDDLNEVEYIFVPEDDDEPKSFVYATNHGIPSGERHLMLIYRETKNGRLEPRVFTALDIQLTLDVTFWITTDGLTD